MSKPRWHDGRSFYSCRRCSSESELTREDAIHPLDLPCWGCGATMRQWVPPAVQRDRELT